MRKRRLSIGFTLMEIIVVMIILGFVVSIALPVLFQNVNKQKAGEALTHLHTYAQLVEGCITVHNSNNQSECANLAISTPTNFPSSNSFSYSFQLAPSNDSLQDNSNVTYTLLALGLSSAGLVYGSDYITLQRLTGTNAGKYTCTLYGVLGNFGGTGSPC